MSVDRLSQVAHTKRYRSHRPRGMSIVFRGLALSVMLITTTSGCNTRYGVSGPEDLGLAARFDPQNLPTTLDPDDPNKKLTRNQVLNQWLIRSDYLCADYQLRLSRSIRDSRLATDFLGTVLSGLATIFAQPAVTRPLSGSATIALGIGGDIQSDLFLQQASDVVGTAIQAVRTRARTELEKKWTAEYADYSLEQGFVDVQRYDRETCTLNVGLNEIRASLNIIGPLAPQANNPIVPLPVPTTQTGARTSPENAASGATAPMATTIIPPNIQKTPQGGFVFTPGKLVTTPADAAPSAVAPEPGANQAPPAPPRRRPTPEPPCQASNPIILFACPPLAPELQSGRKEISDAVRKLKDVAKLQDIAGALGVSTPVPTVRCMRKDILDHIEQICTSDQLQELKRKLPDLTSNK